MKNNEELQEEINNLKEQIKKTKEERKKLDEATNKLQDEVESLWEMLDEMNKSDIENWSHILDKLQKDAAVDAVMASKNKVEA